MEVILGFKDISFCHVSRVFNQKADLLSKLGLCMDAGMATLRLFKGSQLLEEKIYSIY